MKVYIFTRQPMPNGMAGTNRIKCYARALHSVGVSCGIFVFSRDEGNHLACGDIDGVQFRYMLGFSRRWASILGKIQTILMMVALYVKLLFCLKKDDVVFEYSRESYKFVNLIIKLTHFKQAKYVSELCEIPGLGFTHKEAIEENKYIESRLFPQYDGVIAISGSLAHYAKQHCTNYCKIIEVPVLVDSKAFQLTNDERLIKEPYIFYSGSFDDQKDGTIGMFQAFCKVANTVTSTLKFVCTGTKEAALQVGYLSKYIQDEKLERSLIFTGYLKQAEIIKYLADCEMVVSSRYTNEQTSNGFSTKLAEYAAAGKAIVMTPVGEAAKWFHDGDDCLMIPEHNSDALVEAILYLLNNKDERVNLGEGARKMCYKSFDYKVWGEPMKAFFETL